MTILLKNYIVLKQMIIKQSVQALEEKRGKLNMLDIEHISRKTKKINISRTNKKKDVNCCSLRVPDSEV